MPIVCVSMELGALSKEVTQGVSRELGVRPVYPEVLDGAARRMGAPIERIKGVVEGRAGYFEQRRLSGEDLKIFVGAEITAMAAEDNVAFRGWGAEELFRTVPEERTAVATVAASQDGVERVYNMLRPMKEKQRFLRIAANF